MADMKEDFDRAKQNEGAIISLMASGKVAMNESNELEVVMDAQEQKDIADSFKNLPHDSFNEEVGN